MPSRIHYSRVHLEKESRKPVIESRGVDSLYKSCRRGYRWGRQRRGNLVVGLIERSESW